MISAGSIPAEGSLFAIASAGGTGVDTTNVDYRGSTPLRGSMGFFEISAIVAGVGISIGVCIFVHYSDVAINDVPPKIAAEHWAEKMKVEYVNAYCMEDYSLGRLSVDCSVAIRDPEKYLRIYPLECAKFGTKILHGCRLKALQSP